ncbi:hypothetical protein R6Q59_020872 [Mikania micrantha]
MGYSSLHCHGPIVRRVLFNRHGADPMGLQLGDISVKATGSGMQHGDCDESGGERGDFDDFLSLYKAISIGGAFFLFTGIAAVGCVFFYTLFPETQGKSLEEVEQVFGSFFRWRSTQAALDRKKEAELTVAIAMSNSRYFKFSKLYIIPFSPLPFSN